MFTVRILFVLASIVLSSPAWGAKISFHSALTLMTNCDPYDLGSCNETSIPISKTEIELKSDYEVWNYSVKQDGINFDLGLEIRRLSDVLYEVAVIVTATESANPINFSWASFSAELNSGDTVAALSTRTRPMGVGNLQSLIHVRVMELTATP